MYAFVKNYSAEDKKNILFSINSFEYYNEVMHKNFFVKSEIKKEKDHLLTNIRDDSDNVVRGLNEKISTDQADNKKQYLISQFRKIQSNCQIYNSNTDSESISKDVVRNIFYYGNNIGSRLNTFSIRNNQSIKDAATLKKDNTKESLGWDSIISSADDTKENSNTVSSRLDTNPLPKTLINLDKSLEQKQLEQESTSGPEISKMRNTVQPFFKKLVDNNLFCMQVPDNKYILKNIMLEHFKSVIEVRKFNACNSGRKTIAKKLFGIDDDINSFREIDFEKYGYLGIKSPYMVTKKKGSAYGDIKFIFKKNSLLNRTTLTVGDSAVNSSSIMASRVTNPKIESIYGVIDKEFSYLKVIYDLINDGKIDSSMDPADIVDTITKENKDKVQDYNHDCVFYFELQYHGNLTMDDVEEVKIPEEKKEECKEIIQLLGNYYKNNEDNNETPIYTNSFSKTLSNLDKSLAQKQLQQEE